MDNSQKHGIQRQGILTSAYTLNDLKLSDLTSAI
jgi:hypothetical protein